MALPGADVTLINRATNQTFHATTDHLGNSRFSLLAPGAYGVTFASAGYKTSELATITVSVSEAPTIEAQLEPGAADEPSVCQCLVDVTSSSSGTVVDQKTITSVPLNTRNFTQVLSISSGSAADINNAGNLGRNNQAVNVNGNTTAGTFTIDGAVAPGTAPNPDAISEVKIDTSQYDAGFGAQVPSTNLVTRSGSNQYHGTLWEFLRNDVFNANEFFRNATGQSKPSLKQNQFGATFGGPLKKDRLFFFGTYQGTRQVNGLDPSSVSALILPALGSDRSAAALAAQFCPGNHPGDSRYLTFAGGRQLDCSNQNTTTTAALNPIALRILQAKLPDGSFMIPSPQTILTSGANAGLGFSSYSLPSTYKENHFLLNGDYVLSQKHTVLARFFAATIDQYRTFGSPGGFPGAPIVPGAGAPQQLNANDYIGAIKLNSVLSPTVSNELRLALTRSSNVAGSDGSLTAASVGITPANPNFPEPPEMTVLGPLGSFRFFGNANNDFSMEANSTVLADNVSWSHGKQNFRTGGAFMVLDNFRNDISGSRGKITFQTFSDFLVGLNAAGNASASGRSNIQTIQAIEGAGEQGEVAYRYRRYYGSTYLQDDVKLTSHLALNLGLRWEYIGPSFDRAGTIGGVNPTLLRQVPVPPLSGTLVGNTLAANYNPDLINPYTGKPFGPPPPGVVIQSTNSLYQNGAPLNAFAPRAGFAWQPGGKKLSVRGGYGWFYQTPLFSGNATGAPTFTSAPFAQSFTNSDVNNSSSSLERPFPVTTLGFIPRTPTSRLSDRIAGPEYKLPLLQQWNLSSQWNMFGTYFLDVGYVGSRGSRLLLVRGLNQPLLASSASPVNCGYTGTASDCITTNTSQNAGLRVPIMGENPNALGTSEFSGTSWYHSAQVTLRKQVSRGLSFQFAYTFAKGLNNTTVLNDQNSLASDWARASFDRTHRVIANFSYAVPAPRALGVLLRGWSITGLIIAQSGLPMTLTDPNGGGVYGRAGTSTATLCPGLTYDNLSTPGSVQSRLGGWINTSAFCAPQLIGTDRNATGYGNTAQRILNGPSQFNTDFSIGRSGRVGGLREDAQLAFRVEFYNALNHPQFANPGTTLGTATFGVITQSAVAPRLIQFGLKYMF